jgi:hypothetical protein
LHCGSKEGPSYEDAHSHQQNQAFALDWYKATRTGENDIRKDKAVEGTPRIRCGNKMLPIKEPADSAGKRTRVAHHFP